MAAALLDHLAAGRVRVNSAGSHPASQLNPAVVQAMAKIGLDISREFSKPLTTGQVQAADVVITMGCGGTCPVFPGQRYLDWDAVRSRRPRRQRCPAYPRRDQPSGPGAAHGAGSPATVNRPGPALLPSWRLMPVTLMVSRASVVHDPPPLLPAWPGSGHHSPSKIIPHISGAGRPARLAPATMRARYRP